jgi:predicted RNA-binding protein (virulence factor B family)
MLQVGTYQDLKMTGDNDLGIILSDEEGNEVFLYGKEAPEKIKIGDELRVFVYRDTEDRLISTLRKPAITLHHFAFLPVLMVNKFGAFLDWGLEKNLFVPFQEQAIEMVEGRSYIVYMYEDDKTGRLVGSGRVKRFLNNDELTLRTGDEVEIMIWEPSLMGINVIVNHVHQGLIYDNELFAEVNIGDIRKAYIKRVREGNKLDISLQKQGFENIEPNAQFILDLLKKKKDGFLGLNDASSPAEISRQLEMSKKTFKKAIGTLYRKKMIILEAEGIRLVR